MKHYTLRTLIHDAKVFNQLRREYRRTKKNRGTSSEPDWRSVAWLAWGDARELDRIDSRDPRDPDGSRGAAAK